MTSDIFVNIAAGNALSPVWRQDITWTSSTDLLLIRRQGTPATEGTYFNEILFEIQKFSFKKMH